MLFPTFAFLSCVSLISAYPGAKGNDDSKWKHHEPYKHVITISVDGMHASDVEKWLALKPSSNISQLLQTGYEYTNALTSAPSDSFPGAIAQFTGGSPRTTGIWYDDVWDRSIYSAKTGCSGSLGGEALYDESIDYNSSQLFSGGINQANLPLRKQNGRCEAIFPHQRLRVNTIFEVVRKHGGVTAYTDKHPAYDIVRGPSGQGLTVGYFPEIASVANTLDATISYDQLHVQAWLDWLDGKTPEHSEGALPSIPKLMGGNLQSLSVAQKTVGYNNDSTSSFSPAIVQAMQFVDSAIGSVRNKLKEKKLDRDTLIIVASKHGQAPIQRSLYQKVDPVLITNTTGVPVAFQTSDDIALIFLNKSSDAATAAANLAKNRSKCKIQSIIWGKNLTESGYGDPTKDPRVPDIIVQPELGVIYTTSTKKVAEHGGISRDDRNVACFLSSPRLSKKKFDTAVLTTQVGPTVLRGLGIDPKSLEAAKSEGTKVLPGF